MSNELSLKRLHFPEPKNGEPWVQLPDGEDFKDWKKDDEIVSNQTNRQCEKFKAYMASFDFIKDNNVIGDYHEFGCHRVRTFRMALSEAKRHMLDDMNFYAYDSFEGLPETTENPAVEMWKTPGVLATSEEQFMKLVNEHDVYSDRVKTIKGFYSDSLTHEVSAEIKATDRKASFICIDCDFYESAADVFKFIDPFLQQGTIIYIDDLFAGYKGSPHEGVMKAFLEYQNQTKFNFLPHMQVGWWGRTYIVYEGAPITGIL